MRKLKNPNQTQEVRTYYDHNNISVVVPQDGVIFSDDKEMDATVEHFKKVHGFIEVKVPEKSKTAAEKKAEEKEAKKEAEKESESKVGGNK